MFNVNQTKMAHTDIQLQGVYSKCWY